MFYHSENRGTPFLHEIGNYGYAMFYGQEWGDHQWAKKIVIGLENKFALVWQIPGWDVILREPDDKVLEQKIIENIKIYRPGSGYILSTGRGINRCTSFKLLDMMLELAEKYGIYKTKGTSLEPEDV